MQFVYFIEKFAYISTVVASACAPEGNISVTCEQGKKGLNLATDLRQMVVHADHFLRNSHTGGLDLQCIFPVTELPSISGQGTYPLL